MKAVIFDLDGTLLDTLVDLANAVNAALERNEMPVRTLEEIRQFVGNGARNLLIRSVPDGLGNPAFEKTLADFRSYYTVHCKDYTRPYEGIQELLAELKQQEVKMAIVSNKPDSAVKELAKEYFGEYITVAIGDQEGVARKPAPDTVFKALEALEVCKEEAVYVGDSDVDIMTAMNAEMPCISVTWGFRDREFLMYHGASYFADTTKELEEVLRSLW
ncbi:MAG: HAD-IA family hydrolase [Lachnospiraceae bacterium]|nr:HAD-IA family hydrolase [Lachnospiraceae bacterium]